MVINAMRNLTVRVFEHLEIVSPIYKDIMLVCAQLVIRGSALKKYQEVLVTCKQSSKELAGADWTWGDIKGLYTEAFWDWEKTGITGYDVHPYLPNDKFVDFERYL